MKSSLYSLTRPMSSGEKYSLHLPFRVTEQHSRATLGKHSSSGVVWYAGISRIGNRRFCKYHRLPFNEMAFLNFSATLLPRGSAVSTINNRGVARSEMFWMQVRANRVKPRAWHITPNRNGVESAGICFRWEVHDHYPIQWPPARIIYDGRMCGIAGYIGDSSDRAEPIVAAMTDCMA